MNEPPLNPDPPKPSVWERIYTNNEKSINMLIKALVLALLTWIGLKVEKVHDTTELNKDIATKVQDTQQKVVAVEVRGTEQDVAALKATTQPETK